MVWMFYKFWRTNWFQEINGNSLLLGKQWMRAAISPNMSYTADGPRRWRAYITLDRRFVDQVLWSNTQPGKKVFSLKPLILAVLCLSGLARRNWLLKCISTCLSELMHWVKVLMVVRMHGERLPRLMACFIEIHTKWFCQSCDLQFGWSLGHSCWRPQRFIYPQGRVSPFAKRAWSALFIKIQSSGNAKQCHHFGKQFGRFLKV